MNFDQFINPCSPTYSISNGYYPQSITNNPYNYDYCYQQQQMAHPPPSQSYTEQIPVTRVEQDYVPVTRQDMVPVERKQIDYIPQITNDIHHFHETQLQPTILESKQIFTHAGLEKIPDLQKQLICSQQKYEEQLRNQQEKVSLLQKKIDFLSTNNDEQLRDLKRIIDEKDSVQLKLQKELQILKNSELILKEKESDFKFFEKKISMLKLKNKEINLDNEKQQEELNKYKQRCKELEKQLKKQEETNQSLQCQSSKFDEQLLMIKHQYEQEISNQKHTIDKLSLENLKLTKKYKKICLKKYPEKPLVLPECPKENIQKQVLMPIPQVIQQPQPVVVEKKKPKKKQIIKKKSPRRVIVEEKPIRIKQEIVKPCIPVDPKMPKSVMNLYMKDIDECTCI